MKLTKEQIEKIIRILEIVFISGETYMVVAWTLFILGIILGAIIF
jgi:hypothetical protein